MKPERTKQWSHAESAEPAGAGGIYTCDIIDPSNKLAAVVYRESEHAATELARAICTAMNQRDREAKQ